MKPTALTTHNYSRTSRKMNWNDTNAHHSPLYRKKIHLPLVAYIMLFSMYSMPMVSCRTILDIDNDDGNRNQENSLLGQHNNNILNEKHNNGIHLIQQKRKNPSMHPLNEWSLGDITNGSGNDEEITRKIQEKVRRRNRNKTKYNKDKSHKDYDETLQKLQRMKNTEIRSDFRYIESDKKYFDYFPIEKIELNSNETEADDNIKVIFLSNDDDDSNNNNKKQHRKKWKKFSDDAVNKRHSHIRSRRSAPINPSQLDNPIQKRNIDSNGYVENVLGIEQGSVVPRTNLIRKNRDEIGAAEENGRYYSHGTISDPWNNRFLNPFSSFQLPVQSARVLTAVPLIKYPIPGIYYNPISPPGNQPSRKPSTDEDTPSIGNRFGDDRVIWDIQYTRRPVASAQRPSSATRRPPVASDATQSSPRRPPPPLIRNPSRDAVTQRPTVSSFPSQSSNDQSSIFSNGVNILGVSEATTRRPSPSLFHSPSRDATTQRTTTTTTRRPSPTRRPEPSKCVWAIVSCCSKDNLTVRYSCFEQIGCHGAFWDLNPCADDIQEAALAEAEKYFD